MSASPKKVIHAFFKVWYSKSYQRNQRNTTGTAVTGFTYAGVAFMFGTMDFWVNFAIRSKAVINFFKLFFSSVDVFDWMPGNTPGGGGGGKCCMFNFTNCMICFGVRPVEKSEGNVYRLFLGGQGPVYTAKQSHKVTGRGAKVEFNRVQQSQGRKRS